MMETRPFGQTGERFPILSLGCQRLVDDHDCTEEQAVAILETALARGIRYFDTAWLYSAGQSEQRVGLVAKTRRDEMWIATKLWDPDGATARRQLEESLTRLQTDHVDEWRMHDVHSYERLEAMFAKGGALEAMLRARDEGLVRNISISGHANPQVLIEALQRYPFDTTLLALGVMDHFIYSFADEFLPLANAKGVATIGMKVFGFNKVTGPLAKDALRYTLGLPVSTVIVGCSTMAQLKADLAVAESFEPLTDIERLALFKAVMPLVKPENMPWKANSWTAPNAWRTR